MQRIANKHNIISANRPDKKWSEHKMSIKKGERGLKMVQVAKP